MKKRIQFFAILLFLASTASAQWVEDSVSMGAGYMNNVFYSLGANGGIQKTEPSGNWHIALSMNALDSASVMANQLGGAGDFVKVYNIHQPISAWNTVTVADTAMADTLYNGTQGWYQGAFNQIDNPSAFNYGWGTYNIATHKIKGDSMFIIKTGGAFYKLAIDSLNPVTYDWYIRVQKMDLIGMTQAYTISKSSGYNDRLFAYFNLDNGQVTDREPDVRTWDFEFIQYPEFILAGPSTSWRGVSGVLHNRGRLVAEARAIDIDDALSDYSLPPAPSWQAGWDTSAYTTIGYDWKVFDLGTFQYIITDSLSYFVKSVNDSVYQLQFTGFGGGQNGQFNFRYRPVPFPVAVSDVDLFAQPSIFPNPAQDQVNVLFEAAKSTEAVLRITALNGQQVYSATRKIDAGLNAWQLKTSSLTPGHYIVTIGNSEGNTSQKMIISR